jgi:hypothetical protein
VGNISYVRNKPINIPKAIHKPVVKNVRNKTLPNNKKNNKEKNTKKTKPISKLNKKSKLNF